MKQNRIFSLISLALCALLSACAYGQSGVTITPPGSGNMQANSIVLTNLTASVVAGTDANKKVVSSTLTVAEANALHTTPPATAASVNTLSNRVNVTETTITYRVASTNGTAMGLTVDVAQTNSYATANKLAEFGAAKQLVSSTHSIDQLLKVDENLADLGDVAQARINLGLAIGSNVQAHDSDLTALGNISALGFLYRTGSGTAAAYFPNATQFSIVGTNFSIATSAPLDAPAITKGTINWGSTMATDDTYAGTTRSGLVNSGGVTQWDAVYLNSSSQWALADANGGGTFPCRGLVVATAANLAQTIVITSGTVRNDAWTWTPGGTIYLSNTAGGLTQTPPSTSTEQVQPIGYALDADTMAVEISRSIPVP